MLVSNAPAEVAVVVATEVVTGEDARRVTENEDVIKDQMAGMPGISMLVTRPLSLRCPKGPKLCKLRLTKRQNVMAST
jgi:hypothetical protein